MDAFWNAAVAICGLAGIGAFVFYGLYRKWLALSIFAKLTRHQTFVLMLSFLVLTFLSLIVLTLTYFVTRDHSEQDRERFIAVLNSRASDVSSELESVIWSLIQSLKSEEDDIKHVQTIAFLRDARSRFNGLQQKHVDAVRAGNIYLTHEIARKINTLLSTVREQLYSLEESDRKRAELVVIDPSTTVTVGTPGSHSEMKTQYREVRSELRMQYSIVPGGERPYYQLYASIGSTYPGPVPLNLDDATRKEFLKLGFDSPLIKWWGRWPEGSSDD